MNQYDKIISQETPPDKIRILVVDDEENILQVVKGILETDGFKVTTCLDTRNAIDELNKKNYSLVITDLMMPGFSGFEFAKKVKEISPGSDVIVMTGFPSVETAVECMKHGAVDYIAKPFNIEYFNIIVERTLYKRVLEKRASEREYYEQISRVDGLTGLYNHSFFFNLLETEISRADRYEHSFSLIMIDIDDFKKINDKHGHQTGDKVLKELASIFKSLVRKSDPVIRYGGEEFAIILSETAKQYGRIFADRIVKGVASTKIEVVPQDETLTISAGLAGYPDDAETQEDLINKADKALYQAKKMGKNALFIYES